ncbi:hypothetical protein [Thioalkalivibrio sp. ALJ7]|uniref:hypothetical protein n=1 Tax=Thioalkalivibrio sp. ALJ7 TaxID=1158756 RepID=UPI000363A3EB|nr:hypothetical protein [Thioalkalivibrio sp. ALJ7]
MPLPTALIHLDADAAQVVRQVCERSTGKLIPGHRGLSVDELVSNAEASREVARIGAGCLQARGWPILSLTDSGPPRQHARRVIGCFQGLAA